MPSNKLKTLTGCSLVKEYKHSINRTGKKQTAIVNGTCSEDFNSSRENNRLPKNPNGINNIE
jgi:hypothetical protein